MIGVTDNQYTSISLLPIAQAAMATSMMKGPKEVRHEQVSEPNHSCMHACMHENPSRMIRLHAMNNTVYDAIYSLSLPARTDPLADSPSPHLLADKILNDRITSVAHPANHRQGHRGYNDFECCTQVSTTGHSDFMSKAAVASAPCGCAVTLQVTAQQELLDLQARS